jgi:pyrroline-5-carboxylate reductase
MTISQRVGIVGGNGWLGTAMAQAALSTGVSTPDNLTISSRSGLGDALKQSGAHWTSDNEELVRRSDLVVLSIRPAQFGQIAADMSGKLVVSVMAGISCNEIASRTRASRIVRAMPNAAAAIRKSFTPWFATEDVSPADRAAVQAFFAACGEPAEVQAESDIDYCAVMTGTGAAFPSLLAEAMIADAIARGLQPDFAAKAAKCVICNASQLLANPKESSARIVRELIDYGGLTAAALETMLARGFNEAVSAGFAAALARGMKIASKAN